MSTNTGDVEMSLGEDGPAMSGAAMSMMSHGATGSEGVVVGLAAAATQSQGSLPMRSPGPLGDSAAMRTPLAPRHNAAMATPNSRRTPQAAPGGVFTPAKPLGGGSTGGPPPSATPRTGRRDLGAAPLHLWNLNQQTPATTPGRTHTGSIISGDDGDNAVYTKVWGTDINVNEVQRQYAQFVRGFREQQPAAAGSDPGEAAVFAAGEPKYLAYLRDIVAQDEDNFSLDCRELASFAPQLYRNLLAYPREVIPILDEVTNAIARTLRASTGAPGSGEGNDGGSAAAVQDEAATGAGPINVRPYNLEARDVRALRDLDPADVEALVQVDGLVTRVSAVTPDMRVAKFTCEKCRQPVWVANEAGKVKEPTICPNQLCGARHFLKLVHNECLFSDKQLVKLQESPDLIPEGETPHAITVFVYDALVDFVRPGDRVTVVGMFRAMPVRPNPRLRIVKSILRTHIDVLHVQRQQQGAAAFASGGGPAKIGTAPTLSARSSGGAGDGGLEDPGTPRSHAGSETGSQDMALDSQDPFGLNNVARVGLRSREDRLVALGRRADVYERLTASLAPSIWQLDDVKKGILCQLFGGVTKEGMKSRNMINILLVGDPGVAKSQLLSYVHKVAPRGLYTSGRGSSAVGLTAYVAKDPDSREHVLESGALVLSDEGVCCIDEFDKMSDSARAMLHEVMEQQTVSVAKAGIIATLNARTSVLAAANPRASRYDARASIVDNIALPPTLLSRFDLIYLLLDKADAESDQRLARHLASLYWDTPPEHTRALVSADELREYIAFARARCHPRLGDAACVLLAQGYLEMRSLGQDAGGDPGRNVISATPRQLESLIRLSEALARMELQAEVAERHVQEALRLMRVSMQQAATDARTGLIDMDKLFSGVGALDRELRRHLATVIAELLVGSSREMSVLEITDAINEAAGAGGVHATHALVQKVLSTMEGVTYDSARGRARAAV